MDEEKLRAIDANRAERACQLIQEHADSWYLDVGTDSYCVWDIGEDDFDSSMLSQSSDFVTAILAAVGEGDGKVSGGYQVRVSELANTREAAEALAEQRKVTS